MGLGWIYWRREQVGFANEMKAAKLCASAGRRENCRMKSRPDCTGKIGVTGFCYGGNIANTLAVRLGADMAAAVPFYGAVPAIEDIPKIQAAILVHHGELDTRLAATWPAYEAALKAVNVATDAISILGLFTASIVMRRLNATTKPRPT